MAKKIFYFLMEQELENTQMEELENNTQMAHMRHLIDNDLRSIFINNINHSIA